MSAERLRALIGGASITVLAAAAIGVGSSAAPVAAIAADPGASAQAQALTVAAEPDAADAARQHAPGKAAAARAGQLAGQVPLPVGEAFDDIEWNNGTLSDVDIQALIEANAACKWWMASADAPSKETAKVVASIPSWPTMRRGDRHEMAVMMASNRDAPEAAQLLRVCRAELG